MIYDLTLGHMDKIDITCKQYDFISDKHQHVHSTFELLTWHVISSENEIRSIEGIPIFGRFLSPSAGRVEHYTLHPKS